MLYILSATSTLATELYRKFPSNIYQLNKFISLDKDSFKKNVVCQKYFSLRDFSDWIDLVEGIEFSKKNV